MITCLYCGYECPDDAQVCPNCGKPLPLRVATTMPPNPANMKKLIERERSAMIHTSKKSRISKILITTVIVVMLILALYKFIP